MFCEVDRQKDVYHLHLVWKRWSSDWQGQIDVLVLRRCGRHSPRNQDNRRVFSMGRVHFTSQEPFEPSARWRPRTGGRRKGRRGTVAITFRKERIGRDAVVNAGVPTLAIRNLQTTIQADWARKSAPRVRGGMVRTSLSKLSLETHDDEVPLRPRGALRRRRPCVRRRKMHQRAKVQMAAESRSGVPAAGGRLQCPSDQGRRRLLRSLCHRQGRDRKSV